MKKGATTMQRYRHDPSKNLVGFVVCDVEYAVSISRVKEIANPLHVVALPHAPPSVVGVADYRGDVVKVIDLRVRFGLPPALVTRKTKWIVIDVGPGAERGSESNVQHGVVPAAVGARASGPLVALVVDAVTDVFGTGGAELRPAPELGGGDDARGIAGVTTHANRLVFVLDTARLRDLADRLADASGPTPPGQDSGERAAVGARSLPERAVS